MEITNDINNARIENIESIDANNSRGEAIAGWVASFGCALACTAALPMGLRAGWELDLTPMQLAFVVVGGWLLGIAAGGYASLFWTRLLTPKGRAAMLVAASWAAGGLCSVSVGGNYLVLLGLLAMISAAIFASQFRPRAATPVVLASAVWAIAGVAAGLLLAPSLFDAFVPRLGEFGAWRMVLAFPAAFLLLAAAVGYQLTRPAVEPRTTTSSESAEYSTPEIPAQMAAAA